MNMKVSKKTEIKGFSERMRLYLEGLLDEWKIIIPSLSGGWYTSNVGSGRTLYHPNIVGVYTGITANSQGMLYAVLYPLNSGDLPFSYCDWTKRMEVRFEIRRGSSDPECVGRVQIKEGYVEGALAQRGIGVYTENFLLYGESFGTARGTIYLDTLVDNRIKRVKIVKLPERVEFWVDGVKRGELTGAYVPNVKGTTHCFTVVSIINGPTGGVDANLAILNLGIAQEW